MEGINAAELRHIHDVMLELYGGLKGEKDPGMIDYVCEKPFLEIFNQEQYPSIDEKAAVFMCAIAKGHYFLDANKRTAAMAVYTFLMKDGFEIIVSNENLFHTCQNVAKGNLREKDVVKWLESNSYPVDE